MNAITSNLAVCNATQNLSRITAAKLGRSYTFDLLRRTITYTLETVIIVKGQQTLDT
ncbi:hypothetical protein SIAM614_21602 [Stappia aggregata IAM 12614]|uniref:Uncharacterized protein n=1 Tax=Roseibium aggregatum (strain ATCC 25650 / DSM 13394 / JCM 20685 / NBRC 16684 / NCIMB 2208 / IAM 12614 / B1) TaxID=384765 RepID=A0P355_ROSAI|nr:hypothetical protein SIAM614_21602 [Stappia aggregata IAM 12614] [Roseibium aggregatum IAM 12614]